MSWDAVVTVAVLAVAAAWAGRRLWRAWGPKSSRMTGGDGCGGGCSGCAMGEQKPQDLQELTPRDD